MKPNISEFSYGYAITDELVHDLPGISAAPVFPSLYQEGQSGGGYDVMIRAGATPLFIQFKLCDFMSRATAHEAKSGLLTCPFYRMHLRPARHSRQHELLLALEQSGQLAYYAAPTFHKTEEFDSAFLSRSVVQKSVWIEPSAIGVLPDNDDHHVSFVPDGDAYFCSTPVLIKRPIGAAPMLRRFATIADHARHTDGQMVQRAIESLSELALERHALFRPEIDQQDEELASRHPVVRLAFYAHRILDAQLYLLHRVET
jgi:hypothetical protein